MDGWTDGMTDERTENLPILQDFVPYRGRCPKRGLKIRGLAWQIGKVWLLNLIIYVYGDNK